MDKLRALQYFVVAASEKSLSAAARRFAVSVSAVAKMITALEKSVGVRLFDRNAQGLTLTASGAAYLESCLPAMSQLELADEMLRASASRTPGTVVVGVQHVIAREVVSPALQRFHLLHPYIRLDVRDFHVVTEEQTRGVDVFLVLGWPDASDLVLRQIATARYMVVAAPAYWEAHGMPRRPEDLAHHNCVAIRGVDGTVMDLWTFARDGEQVSVAVGGWLTTGNAHRDMAIELVLAGGGVARILDWTNRRDIASGALVEALSDWTSPEAPPVNLLYRSSVRRLPRVRVFTNFVTELFAELDAARATPIVASGRPPWLKRHYGRASASVRHRRGDG